MTGVGPARSRAPSLRRGRWRGASSTADEGITTPGSDPPPISPCVGTTSTDACAASALPRDLASLAAFRRRATGEAASIARMGISRQATLGIEIRAQGRGQGRQIKLVQTHGPGQWMASARSTAARVPRCMPACGPPSILSPLKMTRSAPAVTGSLHRRFTAGARPRRDPPGTRCRDRRRPARPAAVREPPVHPARRRARTPDGEVAPCTLSSRPRHRREARLVIGQVGPVGRPDLDEPAPLCCITSGMRKLPPISTSSPRATHDRAIPGERSRAPA